MIFGYGIIIISLIIVIIELFNESLTKRFGKNFKYIIILLLVINAIFGIVILTQESKVETYSKSSGIISGNSNSRDITKVLLDVGANYSFTKFPEFTLTGDNTPLFEGLEVWVEDNELKISAIIRDEKGEILANLKANEWQVNPNNILDKNFDKKGVEVIDKKGEVILQADIVGNRILPDGSNTIVINFKGVFTHKNGYRVVLGAESLEGGEAFAKIIPPNLKDEKVGLDKIFKYPSELHPGERI